MAINLGLTLTLPPDQMQPSPELIDRHCVLRQCNRQYITSGGVAKDTARPEEFQLCVEKDKVAFLNGFLNIVGHISYPRPKEGENICKMMLCYAPAILPSTRDMLMRVSDLLHMSIRVGSLWSPLHTDICYQKGNQWIFGSRPVTPDISSKLFLLSRSFEAFPISFHSHHAAMEWRNRKIASPCPHIFTSPKENAKINGIFGCLDNNQSCRHFTREHPLFPTADERAPSLDRLGFTCIHTAHSKDAGSRGRVCPNCRVRILSNSTIDILRRIASQMPVNTSQSRLWTIHCMGLFSQASDFEAKLLCNVFLRGYHINDNLNYPTIHCNASTRVIEISVSSGVLTRYTNTGLVCLIDSVSMHHSTWPSGVDTPRLSSTGLTGSSEEYYSTFFRLMSCLKCNEPPRPTFASVQIINSMNPPVSPGTSLYAPLHISRPLVTTPTLEQLLYSGYQRDYITPNGEYINIKSICETSTYPGANAIPGESLIVLFANDLDNYEDAALLSEGFVARGGFRSTAISRYIATPPHDKVKVGDKVTMKTHNWYKTSPKSDVEPPFPDYSWYSTYLENPGTITDVYKDTDTGEVIVSVLRTDEYKGGDKITMGDGQKETTLQHAELDMPYGVTSSGEHIHPDIVISIASISNRQTIGSFFNAFMGVLAARHGAIVMAGDDTEFLEEDPVKLYRGRSCRPVMRRNDDGSLEHAEASWGILQVWPQMQKGVDKMQYTHCTSGIRALEPTKGRLPGGGPQLSEMDIHLIEAAGLRGLMKELLAHGDTIESFFCMRCNNHLGMCPCTDYESDHQLLVTRSSSLFLVYSLLLSIGILLKVSV